MMKKPKPKSDQWIPSFAEEERDYYREVAAHYEKALQKISDDAVKHRFDVSVLCSNPPQNALGVGLGRLASEALKAVEESRK